MKELRIHGRGGQGSVTAAELIAVAAFHDGMYAQAFPAFGVERRGAPVQAFVRFSSEKIRLRSQIYEPDYIIVQDPTLIADVNVYQGMREGGLGGGVGWSRGETGEGGFWGAGVWWSLSTIRYASVFFSVVCPGYGFGAL